MPGRPGLGDSWRWMRKEVGPALGGQARGCLLKWQGPGSAGGRDTASGCVGTVRRAVAEQWDPPGEDGVGGPEAVGVPSQERGPAP